MTHGGDVWQGGKPGAWLDFSANVRPGGPPEWVEEALRSGIKAARYYPDPRMHAAREGLASYLGLDAACVLPTPGGVAALELAMRARAKGALIPTPCFAEYERLAALNGLRVGKVPLDSLDAAAAELPQGWMICVGNPVNPLGCAPGRERLAALLAAAERADGWLLVDEAFVAYCREHSVIDMVQNSGRLLVAGSMTKVLGIPGARLGYLCARPEVIARLEALQLPWALNCLADAVARALPGHAEEIAAEAADNAARRSVLATALAGLGAHVYPSDASFLLARFGREVAPIAAHLRDRGMLVRACMDFEGVDDGRHLRLAVKDEAANARLIAALEEALSCGESR